jgi:hypothetical protein
MHPLTFSAAPPVLHCPFTSFPSLPRGDQQHFVRRDELRAAWSIFTPLLHAIDRGEISPERYPYGSRGPADQDRFLADSGYLRSVRYVWRPSHSQTHMVQAQSGPDLHGKVPSTSASPAGPAKPNL